MKILFTSEYYYPKVSGVPVVVQYLAEGLVAAGHDVSVVTQQPEGSCSYEVINGVCVYRFEIFRSWRHSYKGNITGYINYVVNSDADVIIMECAECITTDTLLPHLSKIKGKIIFHAHGLSGFDNKFFSIKDSLKHTIGTTYNWINSHIYFNFYFKKAFDYFNACMCLSEVDSGIDYLKSNAKQLFILDNAADNMFFQGNIKEDALFNYLELENSHYLMSCANYTVVKNQKDMIKQYYKSQSSKTYSLVCIGSNKNEYYNECSNLINALELQYGHRDVHLLYGVKRCDIPSIIKGSSLYLVTSRWEQYSISIIEAMSQGVPFISTNVGNARLLPGGITVGSVNEIAQNIDNIMADKCLYENCSRNGKSYAFNNCRIKGVVEKLESIINQVIC